MAGDYRGAARGVFVLGTTALLTGLAVATAPAWVTLAVGAAIGVGVGALFDATLGRLSIWGDPLILDLDGDGVETTELSSRTLFDLDGDGLEQALGWVGPDDGLLVIDLDENGVIDGVRELFAASSDLANDLEDGFDALAELDSNADGVIDIRDDRFGDIQV